MEKIISAQISGAQSQIFNVILTAKSAAILIEKKSTRFKS